MGLKERVSAERVHIGFFGIRNAGKSSVVNAVTGQRLSLVSDTKGTTTDPVQKAMELLPLGPVVIIDTPGIDDEGELGQLRVERARQVLEKTDVAVLVVDVRKGMQKADQDLCRLFVKKKLPYLIAFNKGDLLEQSEEGFLSLKETGEKCGAPVIHISAREGTGIWELKEMLASLTEQWEKEQEEKQLVGDLIAPKDILVLVTPIDESAPKGRLILPQQQMLRDILDHHAVSVVVQVEELEMVLAMLPQKPKLVITDSQAFGQVSQIVPEDTLLTSFSILFARYKGELFEEIKGALILDRLQDGDRILVSEGCTHHRQCKDIGTVKLPDWIRQYTKKELSFEFTSGGEFPETEALSEYALVVHCGACMLNEREMKSRIRRARQAGVPITNYGIMIAQIHGILRRSLSPFPDLTDLWEAENKHE